MTANAARGSAGVGRAVRGGSDASFSGVEEARAGTLAAQILWNTKVRAAPA
jgi:hypothetical protein